jgi:NADH-quinone oxidoreductase subunit J
VVGGLIWYLFAAMIVVSGLVVAFNRNVIRCGFGLLFTLLGVCAMYAFLEADFLAATQVVVYVGGILVLVLFAVMLTNRVQPESIKDELVQPLAALGVALVVLALSLLMIYRTVWPIIENPEIGPTTALMGRAFLTDFLFPFEFASVLLLVAMMGAALIIRGRKSDEEEEEA